MDPQRTNPSQENSQEERKRGIQIPNVLGRRFGAKFVVRAGLTVGRSILMFLLAPEGAVPIAIGLVLLFVFLIIFMGIPGGGGSISADQPTPTPTTQTTPDPDKPPPNTFGVPMVLVWNPDTKTWSYITPSQAALLQAQGGSRLEFHGMVNPAVTKAMLIAIPSEIGPGVQVSTYSKEQEKLVSLAFTMYNLRINRDNNYRWAAKWADPYYMPGGKGYPGHDVRSDPAYNSFLAVAQKYDKDIADNLAQRAAIIAAAP